MKLFCRILVLMAVILTQSCFIPRSPEIPIQTIFYDLSAIETDTLVVLLPGRGDSIDVFEEEGFISAMKVSGANADAVVIDAHLGYYISGQLVERFEKDVLFPYRKKGYRSFILVGTSLGGYGCLWIKDELSDWVEAIVLIAPYLGPEEVIKSVQQSESLDHWKGGLDEEPTEDEFPWIWIKRLVESENGIGPHVLIAVGDKDRFRSGAEILGGLLPESQVFRNSGGHNWKTWLGLWHLVLGSGAWADLMDETYR